MGGERGRVDTSGPSRVSWAGFGARMALSAIFVYASLAKARRPSSLSNSIQALIGHSFHGALIAYVLIVSEGAAGIGMVIPVRRVQIAASFLCAALLIVFILASLTAYRRNIRTSCSCFGRSEQPLGLFTAARAALILPLTILGLVGLSRPRTADAVLSAATAVLILAIGFFGTKALAAFGPVAGAESSRWV
jgi:hypothetical protein